MKRKLKGQIVSDKMEKTAVVAVSLKRSHRKYHKYYTITNRFKAHNPDNQYKEGQEVVIEETRPMSKDKRLQIVSLVSGNNSSQDSEIKASPEESSDAEIALDKEVVEESKSNDAETALDK